MAESIKLNGNKYIDAEGVWDSTVGKTQKDINQNSVKINTLGYGMLSGFKDFYANANTHTDVVEDLESFIPIGKNIKYAVGTVNNSMTPYTEITGPAIFSSDDGRKITIRVYSNYGQGLYVRVGFIVFYN